MNFVKKLLNIYKKNNSLVCIGLDTDIERIPDFLHGSTDPVFEFNKRIIDSTEDLVISYKLNIAFYEARGLEGIKTMIKTVRYIPNEIPVIVDAKRNDIGNTARMYAKALFETYSFDATTVNPYMGYDSIEPFLDYKDRGVIVLCRTTNPGARDFQDLNCGKPLYEIVAESVKKWNVYGNCGVVAGATSPKQLKKIREIVGEDILILIPGIGIQGGNLEDAVIHGTNSHGEMAIINSSRRIIYASNDEYFAETARKATIGMRSEINRLSKSNY
jgi:orotidine-5'-phosphate decarboxylase